MREDIDFKGADRESVTVLRGYFFPDAYAYMITSSGFNMLAMHSGLFLSTFFRMLSLTDSRTESVAGMRPDVDVESG